MKTAKLQRILALALTLAMMMSMILVFTVSGSAENANSTHVLNAEDIKAFAVAAKYDGEYERAGTNNFFTLIYSAKTKVESNSKTFPDGQPFTQRIAWGDKSYVGDQVLNTIKIKTNGSAKIKIWWACGDAGRVPAVYSQTGAAVATVQIPSDHVNDGTDGVKNDLFISEVQVPDAGIYYIGNSGGSNYFYKIEVTDSNDGATPAARADWATVSAPQITSAADDGLGNVEVKVNGLVGHDGADELLVHMYNEAGQLVQTRGSVIEKGQHTLSFIPADSGKYTFKAELYRAGSDKKVSEGIQADFTFVLLAPNISSVTSLGGGKIQVKWSKVHEAESYVVYQGGVKVATLDASYLSYTASGLTVGQEYSYVVSAIRGSEELKSGAKSTVATLEEKREWSFSAFGDSASESKNSYTGSINDNGSVTITSSAGKIKPAAEDGLAFYYTAIPTEYNFTLRARVRVDTWTMSNGQEGFGLLVTDRVGEHGDTKNFWNNSYLAGSTKIEYKYDGDNDEIVDIKVVDSSLTKFSMKLGIGVVARTGVTKENLHLIEGKGDTENGEMSGSQAINTYYVARNYTLDRTAADLTTKGGDYNVIGNYTKEPTGTFTDRVITEYIMEIQKTNSGYFITHYDKDGNMVMQKKFYDPEALNHLDENYVYAGFFAARNVTATFSDVELTTILASEDDRPIEHPPITKVTPTVTVNSGNVTTSDEYELIVDVNVGGTLNVTYENSVIAENVQLDPNQRFRTNISLKHYDENQIKVQFIPDPNQVLGDYVELSSKRPINLVHTLMYNRGNYHRKTIYVSPSVQPYTTTADGTRENPFDLFTAIENAYPGQTLVLMEGTYKPRTSLTIARSMDGTADAMIRLIADPEAKTRPVIDFEGLYNGFTLAGDYWYLRGFDVTGSADRQKGLQISGSHNILDQINAYENGNTGIQLSRLSGSDLYEDWPSYNLILNCTAYRNYDSGFEDADGFAAKLTVGDGNVFDGCIAYHNADDGWDLYSKVESGEIGAVTIRNCIAFENGFVPGIEGQGNGNGFKMGGESLPGKHVLENSIAWNNLAKGIDCNSCPDIIVKNSISFNNGNYNVALYTNTADNTAFVASGIISFRTEHLDKAENLKGVGTQVKDDYINESNYYWNVSAGKSMNTAGVEITKDMFVTIDFSIDMITRNADGTINMGGFLQIKDNAPANVKDTKLGGTASYKITLEEDEECSFSRSWYNLDTKSHWHLCSCGNKSEVSAHDFIWIIDKKVEGNQPGAKHQECTVCGYKKAAISIYPQAPVEPEQPEQPTQPDTPSDGNEDIGFFARIWQAILNFFRKIFGISPKAYLPKYHRWY